MIRFAVLGAGRIGLVHASAITAVKSANLVAIAEPFEAAAKAASEEYGCEIRTIEEIAASDDVDAVAICTPTDTHADLIEKFVTAGKRVFCEKPIDLSVERVKQAIATVKAADGTLMVGFNRRFDPDFVALKAALDSGSVGDVEMVTITSRDPGAPPVSYIERSGGIFRDMTVHDFDMARWLLDEEVTEVQAAGSVLVDPEIGAAGDFDSVNVILKTSSGKQCVITNSRRASYGYDQRIEVHGSTGVASASNVHENRVTIGDAQGFHTKPYLNFFLERYMSAYKAEIASFAEAVECNSTPPTTGHDGLMALVLADAALRSVQEGRVVQVSEILG